MNTCIDATWLAMHPELLQQAALERRQHTGYPADPGTGPKGETCRSCANLCRIAPGAKPYLKCVVMKPFWTHGGATDIKARSPACSYFKVRWEREKHDNAQTHQRR